MPHFECGAFNPPAISPRGQLAFLERGRGEFWLAVLIAAARRDAEVRLATACTGLKWREYLAERFGKSVPYF